MFLAGALGPATAAYADPFPPACTDEGAGTSAMAGALSRQFLAFPDVGKESEAEIGQSMVSSGMVEVRRNNVALLAPIEMKSSMWGVGLKLSFPAGPLFRDSWDGRGTYYKSGVGGDFKYATEPFTRHNMLMGVWLADDPAIPPKVFWSDGFRTRTYDYPQVQFSSGVCSVYGATGFRRELVYSGVSKGTVTILYREFSRERSGDMARPAFSQQLTYDLADGNEIGFRGARFKVIKATNVSISYVVLKPLDGGQ